MSKIRSWLAPPDPWKNYNIGRESRHSGTGAWFMNSSTLSEWKESGPSSLLWIHGKRWFTTHRFDLLQTLMGHSFHSWRWQECTLVRYLFGILS
jgi:hypothetical protein